MGFFWAEENTGKKSWIEDPKRDRKKEGKKKSSLFPILVALLSLATSAAAAAAEEEEEGAVMDCQGEGGGIGKERAENDPDSWTKEEEVPFFSLVDLFCSLLCLESERRCLRPTECRPGPYCHSGKHRIPWKTSKMW